MPNWAIYDTATNRVKKWLTSDPHDPTYPVTAGEGAVKDPNVSALANIALHYWKHSNGSIVEMTTQEKSDVDAELAAASVASTRASAKAMLVGFSDQPLYARALADIIKDEINILRGWLASFKTEVAAATTLADLKTRVAGLPATGDRTLAQLKTAIQNRIDSGTVDE